MTAEDGKGNWSERLIENGFDMERKVERKWEKLYRTMWKLSDTGIGIGKYYVILRQIEALNSIFFFFFWKIVKRKIRKTGAVNRTENGHEVYKKCRAGRKLFRN